MLSYGQNPFVPDGDASNEMNGTSSQMLLPEVHEEDLTTVEGLSAVVWEMNKVKCSLVIKLDTFSCYNQQQKATFSTMSRHLVACAHPLMSRIMKRTSYKGDCNKTEMTSLSTVR